MSDNAIDPAMLTPPIPPKAGRAKELSPDIHAKLRSLGEHFGREGFELASKEGSEEKKPLDEREMMYLVSLLPDLTRACGR